jgi:flagellar biosynthesis regulator FlbT
MTPPDNSMTPSGRTRTPVGLVIAAGLFAVVTCAGILFVFSRLAAQGGTYSAMDVAALVLIALVGLLGVVVCLSLHFFMERQKRQSDTLTHINQQTAIMAEQSIARTSAATSTYASASIPSVDNSDVVRSIEELKEVVLLPEQERQRRFALLVERAFQQRLQLAEQYARSRDFHRARQELDGLQIRFGQRDRLTFARQQLEKAAEAARVQDVANVTQHVNELIRQSRWDEATRAVRELVQKHPESNDAQALAERVAAERKAFAIQHRQRMYEELQNLAYRKQWAEAADATRRFLATFPNDPESEILREQLKTLDANVEIQYRQNVEQEIKSHIAQQRYWDALALARQLIAAYPLSPQANALRPQVPRLEELAQLNKT